MNDSDKIQKLEVAVSEALIQMTNAKKALEEASLRVTTEKDRLRQLNPEEQQQVSVTDTELPELSSQGSDIDDKDTAASSTAAATAAVVSKKKGAAVAGTTTRTPWYERRVLVGGSLLVAFACLMVIVVIVTIHFIKQTSSSSDNNKFASNTFSDETNNYDEYDDLAKRTFSPSSKPSIASKPPTLKPSRFPTFDPTLIPTEEPSKATVIQTSLPTVQPSKQPTTGKPSLSPKFRPTQKPTYQPSKLPTMGPTRNKNEDDDDRKNEDWGPTTFYAIADVPYSGQEVAQMPMRIASIPNHDVNDDDDLSFLVHLGDLFHSSARCTESVYDRAKNLLLQSKIPVFVTVGDNDWNDCPAHLIETGWNRWASRFVEFESNWPKAARKLNVKRQEGVAKELSNNFYFIRKGTLFVGLNLVGGLKHKTAEWNYRLSTQFQFVKSLIMKHYPENVGAVVIFGHAFPTNHHHLFFGPMHSFLRNELDSQLPVLYMHGDIHRWSVGYPYQGINNYLRISLNHGTKEKPVKIQVDPQKKAATDVFRWNRHWN